MSSADQARLLVAKKVAIEAELDEQLQILKSNSADMRSPLVDADGFPRDDIDVFTVRAARVRIIHLRNDLTAIMTEIATKLESVYPPSHGGASNSAMESDSIAPDRSGLPTNVPFARVGGVAPNSPASEAGLYREDLIIRFGHLTRQLTAPPLSALVDVVAASENRVIPIQVLRGSPQKVVVLGLKPRRNWGGQGMLGCHIVPYSAP